MGPQGAIGYQLFTSGFTTRELLPIWLTHAEKGHVTFLGNMHRSIPNARREWTADNQQGKLQT